MQGYFLFLMCFRILSVGMHCQAVEFCNFIFEKKTYFFFWKAPTKSDNEAVTGKGINQINNLEYWKKNSKSWDKSSKTLKMDYQFCLYTIWLLLQTNFERTFMTNHTKQLCIAERNCFKREGLKRPCYKGKLSFLLLKKYL